MIRVFLASPFRGATADESGENVRHAQNAMRLLMQAGCAVFAPHLIYPSAFRDDVEEERNLAINAGVEFLRACDALVFYAPRGQPTTGMKLEIQAAHNASVPVIEMRIYDSVLGFNAGGTIDPEAMWGMIAGFRPQGGREGEEAGRV